MADGCWGTWPTSPGHAGRATCTGFVPKVFPAVFFLSSGLKGLVLPEEGQVMPREGQVSFSAVTHVAGRGRIRPEGSQFTL